MNAGLSPGFGSGGDAVAGPVAFKRQICEGVTSSMSGGQYQVDLSRGTIHSVTLIGNTTMLFPDPRPGAGFTLMVQQDATGARTITWPSTVAWGSGVAPTITSTPGKTDVLSFIGSPDGRRWLGFVGGMNF